MPVQLHWDMIIMIVEAMRDDIVQVHVCAVFWVTANTRVCKESFGQGKAALGTAWFA